jgi:hypothetical protein
MKKFFTTFLISSLVAVFSIPMVYACTADGSCLTDCPVGAGIGKINRPWCQEAWGSINVSSNIASASWTITGPGGPYTGVGLSGIESSMAGTYTVTWGAVSGYTKPVSQSLTLAINGSISFVGTYNSTSCVWGWGSGTAYSISMGPVPTKSSTGCDTGILANPNPACSSSNSGEALICLETKFTGTRYVCSCRSILPTTACLLECEGTRVFKVCPTCAVNDFTCPAGYRLKQNVCGVSVGGAPYGCVKDTSCLVTTPAPTVNLWFTP